MRFKVSEIYDLEDFNKDNHYTLLFYKGEQYIDTCKYEPGIGFVNLDGSPYISELLEQDSRYVGMTSSGGPVYLAFDINA